MADRAIVAEVLSELVGDVSMNPWWRRRMFLGPPRAVHAVEGEGLEKLSAPVAAKIREHGLRFEVFHDGAGDGDAHVLGFRSLDAPDLETYSTNYYQPDGYDRDD